MKVAIIGASGRVGGLVADELVARGHEVTGLVIDPGKIRNKQVKAVEKNVFALKKEDLEEFDVVVSAFGQFTPEEARAHQPRIVFIDEAFNRATTR